MHGAARGTEMRNLRTTRKPASNDDRLRRRRLDLRDQPARANRFRHFVMLAVVAECSRHPAASTVEHLEVEPGDTREQADFMLDSRKRLLMAMPLHDNVAPA